MFSSTIWKKARMSEFFKDYQNSTSPKNECYLRYEKLKSERFSILLEKSCYYQLIIYMGKVIKCRKKVI